MFKGLTLAVFLYLLGLLGFISYHAEVTQFVQRSESAVSITDNVQFGWLGIKAVGLIALLWLTIDLLISIPRRRRILREEAAARKNRPQFDPDQYRFGRGGRP